MAITQHQTTEPDFIFQNSGSTLIASTNVTATAQGAAVTVGKGHFQTKIIITAEDTAIDSTNHVHAFVEANTIAAATTWIKLACLPINAMSIDAVGSFQVTFYNPYDHQIRLAFVATGSPDITLNATLHPINK